MPYLDIALYAALAVVVFNYGVAPLVVRAVWSMPGRYTLPPLDWESSLADRSEAFKKAVAGLMARGFTASAASRFEIQKTVTHFAALRSPNGLYTATVMTVVGPGIEQTAVDFTQLHENGNALTVMNGANPEVFPDWERKRTFRFPKIREVAALHERFSRLRDRSDLGAPRPLPLGRELDAVAAFLNAELDHLVDVGFLRPPGPDGLLRLSLWGAYRSCLRLMWPFKGLINRSDAKRAERAAR